MTAPKHSAAIAVVAAAMMLLSSAVFAFSVHIGSFHITIGSHRHHHNHHPVVPSRPAAPEPAATARGAASPLFYPQRALPGLLANVFSSPPAAWPFDYQSIILTTFTRQEPQGAQGCEPQSNLADKFLAPLGAALALTDAQAQLLDKVGDALDAAQTALVKACPDAVPTAPIARLQLMDSQIDQLIATLGGLRQPLQNFQHALTDEQLARFTAMIAAPSANYAGGQPGDAAPGCGGDASSATDRTISLIDQTVQPTPPQRDALNGLKEALGKAARDLRTDCAAPMPTELGRLGMIATRLDTTRRILRSLEAALTKFRTALNDEQKTRLDAASLAGR